MERYRTVVADNARWEGFEFRAGDIVIATPPKCGTTWTQMICALLILGPPSFYAPLDQISPWLEMNVNKLSDVLATLGAQTHRRFIKSHTPLDGLPFDERVTYVTVGRDPRDVAISEAHHFENTDLERFIAQLDEGTGLANLADVIPDEIPAPPATIRDHFRQWIDDTTRPGQAISTLTQTVHHLRTFWDKRKLPNVVLLHYGDLKAGLEGQIRALASRLSIDLDDAIVPELARAASFDEMKSHAKDVAPNATNPIWRDTTKFFHTGTSGQWRAVLTDEDLSLYAARSSALGPPDFLDWLHHGAAAPADHT
jgi:hypothetical protein